MFGNAELMISSWQLFFPPIFGFAGNWLPEVPDPCLSRKKRGVAAVAAWIRIVVAKLAETDARHSDETVQSRAQLSVGDTDSLVLESSEMVFF